MKVSNIRLLYFFFKILNADFKTFKFLQILTPMLDPSSFGFITIGNVSLLILILLAKLILE